jgi:hypothetical protein
MKKLTDEQIAERLMTPEERWEAHQEELRRQAMRHGGWSSAHERREAEQRRAEQDRHQDRAVAERNRELAEREARMAEVHRAHVDDLLGPRREEVFREFVLAHPDKSRAYFDAHVWPKLRDQEAAVAERRRADDLFRRMGGAARL